MRYQSLNKSGAGFQLHFHPCCNLMFVKQVWVTLCNQSWNNTITLRFQQYHKQRWYLPHFPLDYVWCRDCQIADCSVSQRSTNHGQRDVRWCCLFSSHLVLLIMSVHTHTHTLNHSGCIAIAHKVNEWWRQIDVWKTDGAKCLPLQIDFR